MYRVLLVDDEEMVTQGLVRFVPWEQLGYTVVGTASSAARALAFLESQPVELVITDIHMPVQTGIDLIRILSEQYPRVQSVILSGYSEFAYAQQAVRLGALDYLTKPINFEAMKSLLVRIHNILDEQNDTTTRQIQDMLANTLIMNYAKGNPYDERRMASCLDTACAIIVVRILIYGQAELPKGLVDTLPTALAPCRVVYSGGQELLVVLENPHGHINLGRELDILLQAYSKSTGLCAGVSEEHMGYAALRRAALQAGKAMYYQNARGTTGVMYYRHVEKLFLGTGETQSALVQELITLLSVPEKRSQLVSLFTGSLCSMEEQPDFTIVSAQRFCTELLIDLDAPIRSFALPDYQCHAQLSSVLLRVLGSEGLPEICTHVTAYLQQIVDKLELVNDATLAGELVGRVKVYMEEHFAEDLTLTVLAEVFYISPVYLSRLFKKKAGINYIEYLTTLRIDKAKEYLKDSTLKIYNISEMVGYENSRYFARLFRDAEGCSPQEFRNVIGV